MLGVIFDRYPGLKVVSVEVDLNWVSGSLQDAEMALDT